MDESVGPDPAADVEVLEDLRQLPGRRSKGPYAGVGVERAEASTPRSWQTSSGSRSSVTYLIEEASKPYKASWLGGQILSLNSGIGAQIGNKNSDPLPIENVCVQRGHSACQPP